MDHGRRIARQEWDINIDVSYSTLDRIACGKKNSPHISQASPQQWQLRNSSASSGV